jgi:hypothetical protein
MVKLDHALIQRARSLVTRANIDRIKEMVFIYEEAVRLHNMGAPNNALYQTQYEQELRKFVEEENRPIDPDCAA